MKENVTHPVQPIFNLPVTAIQFQQPVCVRLLGTKAGDSVNAFLSLRLAFCGVYLPLDAKDLLCVGERDIALKRLAHPDSADFNPSVTFFGYLAICAHPAKKVKRACWVFLPISPKRFISELADHDKTGADDYRFKFRYTPSNSSCVMPMYDRVTLGAE